MERLVLSAILFSVVAICGTALYGVVVLLLARAGQRAPSRAERAVCVVAIALFLVGAACFAWGALVEPRRIEVTRHVVETTKLPAGVRLRIAHVTDLHIGLGAPAATLVPALVNAERPDLFVFTGDALNDDGATQDLQRIFGAIEAPLGRLAVRGNHDVEVQFEPLARELEGAPFSPLDGVTVCGASFHARQRVAACLDAAGPGLRIVAFHSPDLVEAVRDVDLYLAGHTHGGQVRLPFYGAAITMSAFGKRYEQGRYQVGGTTLYVNRGVGVSPLPAPPLRFLCRPEVAIIDLVGM